MSNPYDIANKPLVFHKLLQDAPHIEADFAAFKQQYRSLLEVDRASKAIILQSHLVVEYYVTQYLEAANPASPKIGTAKLTFLQKLDLADHPQAHFHFLMDGMRALNGIRNRIAHQLDFVPKEKDFAPILECVRIWNTAAQKPIPQGLDGLSAFTEFVCGFLYGDTQRSNGMARELGSSVCLTGGKMTNRPNNSLARTPVSASSSTFTIDIASRQGNVIRVNFNLSQCFFIIDIRATCISNWPSPKIETLKNSNPIHLGSEPIRIV